MFTQLSPYFLSPLFLFLLFHLCVLSLLFSPSLFSLLYHVKISRSALNLFPLTPSYLYLLPTSIPYSIFPCSCYRHSSPHFVLSFLLHVKAVSSLLSSFPFVAFLPSSPSEHIHFPYLPFDRPVAIPLSLLSSVLTLKQFMSDTCRWLFHGEHHLLQHCTYNECYGFWYGSSNK
jgi:hypothetical protein